MDLHFLWEFCVDSFSKIQLLIIILGKKVAEELEPQPSVWIDDNTNH